MGTTKCKFIALDLWLLVFIATSGEVEMSLTGTHSRDEEYGQSEVH